MVVGGGQEGEGGCENRKVKNQAKASNVQARVKSCCCQQTEVVCGWELRQGKGRTSHDHPLPNATLDALSAIESSHFQDIRP